MAAITLTVPTPVLTRVLDAFAGTYHYNPATDGTKAAFAQARIRDYLRSVVTTYETQLAADTAAATQSAITATDMATIT